MGVQLLRCTTPCNLKYSFTTNTLIPSNYGKLLKGASVVRKAINSLVVECRITSILRLQCKLQLALDCSKKKSFLFACISLTTRRNCTGALKWRHLGILFVHYLVCVLCEWMRERNTCLMKLYNKHAWNNRYLSAQCNLVLNIL